MLMIMMIIYDQLFQVRLKDPRYQQEAWDTVCGTGNIKTGKLFPVPDDLSSIPYRRIKEWSHSSVNLNLGTRWRWVVSVIFQSLFFRGKDHQCPLKRIPGQPQRLSPRCVEEKNLLSLPGIGLKFLGHPVWSQSTYRLNYPGSNIRAVTQLYWSLCYLCA
jgi:hypothetical protein